MTAEGSHSHNRIRILIADDHLVVREGVGAIIALQSDMELAGKARGGLEAVQMAHELKPDVVLIDLVMPDLDGLGAIRQIVKQTPDAKILVLTSFADDEKVYPAIKGGALGYLLKDAPLNQLLAAVRQVAQGQAFLPPAIALKVIRDIDEPPDLPATTDPLTERELDTLRLIARGLTNQEIAADLNLHEYTVAKHVSSILSKLHLANRTQATL
jgi:NarL family two-component system response regulator LiaR